MTNQEILDTLDEGRRAIANNILANENGGMGVHDVNSLPKSTWNRIMKQTEELATGKEVSNPSATTEAIKANKERDAEAFTKANSTTLKDHIDDTINDAKNGITATNFFMISNVSVIFLHLLIPPHHRTSFFSYCIKRSLLMFIVFEISFLHVMAAPRLSSAAIGRCCRTLRPGNRAMTTI